MDGATGQQGRMIIGESPALWGAKRFLLGVYAYMRPHRFQDFHGGGLEMVRATEENGGGDGGAGAPPAT